MWCIVNLPNGTQQAVKWDPKAIGQECLEKVCKALGIICEMEYFGLEHWIPSQKETRTHQWINLRNRLSCDGGSGSGIQLMLALRVKFWVPVHFILQESARNLFFMQAKADLLEGRLRAKSWSSAAKLAALLCQADGLHFKEASLTFECPLKIQREQERQKCLQQQPQQQQMNHQQQWHQQGATIKERKEKDYVLSFKKRRLSKQKSVENINHAQLSTQASTSHAGAFTTTPTSDLRETENNPSTSSTKDSSTKVSENVNSTCDNKTQQESDLYAEKFMVVSPLRIYQNYLIRPINEKADADMPDDFLKQIAAEHGKLSLLKMSPKSAKYWLLQEIQDLPGYGEEIFSGMTTTENSQSCDIAVGAHCIKVCSGESENNIPFSAIAAAKSFRRTFKLEYVDDHNTKRELEIKLPKHAIAAGLYRSITERHAFYVCDKVRGVVTNQFTRDLKGTIASMFKEDTELGKRYVFDIQHTSREVQDQARRILHERGIETSAHNSGSALMDFTHYMSNFTTIDNTETSDRGGNISSLTSKLDLVLREKEKREADIERCVDSRISEAMTCKICMDRAINTMFNTCRHVMACDECAIKCDNCPNCRVKITSIVKIFLPPELRISQSSSYIKNLSPA